jgi:hypothetical protein
LCRQPFVQGAREHGFSSGGDGGCARAGFQVAENIVRTGDWIWQRMNRLNGWLRLFALGGFQPLTGGGRPVRKVLGRITDL